MITIKTKTFYSTRASALPRPTPTTHTQSDSLTWSEHPYACRIL